MRKLIAKIVTHALIMLINGTIKGGEIDEAGIAVGRWITVNCKERLTGDWDKLEDVLQAKTDRFMNALHTGLDSDDRS